MDFQIFKNRYHIKGTLIVETALHIGSGKEESGADAPFIKTGDNGYYIPGSSIRGYFRTKLERFLNEQNSLGLKYRGENLNSADVMLLFGYTNLDRSPATVRDRVMNLLGESKIDNIKSMAGRIHIGDMGIKTVSKEIKRDGIKIDEDTGTVAQGAKFDYNVLPAGTEFEFEIIGENLEDYQLDLIKLMILDLENGDVFGGKTSRGIGKCKLALSSEIDLVRADNKDELKKYIFERKMAKAKTDKVLEIKNIQLA